MKSITEMTNNPRNIIVATSDRFFHPTARVVSKRTLRKAVSSNCQFYINGLCQDCFINELEVNCIEAWQLTKGKGKKIY